MEDFVQKQLIFSFNGRVFVTSEFLFKRGIPKQTVYNNTSRKAKRPWTVIGHPSSSKLKLIDYNSLSDEIKNYHSLPDIELLHQIAERNNRKIREQYKKKSSRFIQDSLYVEYLAWQEVRPLYANEFVNEDAIESFCKTHMVLQRCIELNDLGYYTLKEIYNAYSCFDDLIFITDYYRSFCNKIAKLRKGNSIEEILLHGLKNRISNNSRLSSDIINEIKYHYCNSKKLNASNILDRVNDYLLLSNRQKISISSIYTVISQPYVQLECMYSRFGGHYMEMNMLPHMHFLPPQNEGTLWLLDGSRFQFAFKPDPKSGKSYKTLIYYVVMDAKSRKIIGYSLYESENTEMALKAFEMACKNTKFLPIELIQDRSPAHRSKKYEELVAKAKLLGVNWRYSHDPKDNSYVERFFGIFQEKFCKKYDGYLGDGIKSKNPQGKPSEEEIKKHLHRKRLRTRSELLIFVDQLIKEYNNSEYRKRFVEKWDKKDKRQKKLTIDPIQLNNLSYAYLFWKHKDLTLVKGSLRFKINGEEYVYNIHSIKILAKWKDLLRVYYNESDLSTIYVYDKKESAFLGKLKQFNLRPKLYAERTEEDKEYLKQESKKKRNLKKRLREKNNNIKEQSKENNWKLSEILNFDHTDPKEVREIKEATLIEKELHNQQKIKESKRVEERVEKVDYAKLFRTMHAKQIKN